jgi:hypothetical protein
MSPLRSLPPRLLVLGSVITVAAAGGAAIALGASGPSAPPAKPLDVAVHDALTAPPVAGVTARIKFTDKLIDASSLQGGSPLLKGATGRLWASKDGRVRLELQSDGGNGDVQAVIDRTSFSLYDPASRTVYRGKLPASDGEHEDAAKDEAPPTLAAVGKAIARISRKADLSGAKAGVVAGHGAYTVRVSPKRDGGLLGGVELAWDAVRGAPLRAAVYAADAKDPVLELTATDVRFGPVAAGDLDAPPPAGAKVVDLSPPSKPDGGEKAGHEGKGTTGLAAVQAKAPFTVTAPDTLVGLPRGDVRLIERDGTPAVLVTYGRGLGGLAVLQTAAAKAPEAPAAGKRDESAPKLPTVDIGGRPGTELDTALGTVLRFERGGVSFVLAGSIPPTAAEAAARALR